MKKIFFIPIVSVYGVFLLCLICLNISCFYYRKSKPDYVKALFWLKPVFIPLAGDIFEQNIQYRIGKMLLSAGQEQAEDLKSAVDHYQAAVRRNPLDLRSAQGLADAMFRMEKSYGAPYDALPFFERLSRMAPNDVDTLFATAEYFHFKGLNIRLNETAGHMAQVYPPVYSRIKKAIFYTDDLRQTIGQGLEAAGDFFMLGRFYKDGGLLEKAIGCFREGIRQQPVQKSSRPYFELADLLLRAGDIETAGETFETVIGSVDDPGAALKRIWGIYKHLGYDNEFLAFAGNLEKKYAHLPGLDILAARSYLRLDLVELARARLQKAVTEKKTAEGYYLLALADKAQKDWDGMELNIQKATVLEPANCVYYSLFAHALGQQGKKIQANLQYQKANQCRASLK